MIDLKILGANIQMHRKLKNMTQEELADKAGISKVYLQQVECGNANLTFNFLNKILLALEIRLVYRLEDKHEIIN